MFVFPAFNQNYKTRKRAFRCCRQCRTKRVRCIVLDANYETHGCDNCRSMGALCDLAVPGKDDGEPRTASGASLGLSTPGASLTAPRRTRAKEERKRAREATPPALPKMVALSRSLYAAPLEARALIESNYNIVPPLVLNARAFALDSPQPDLFADKIVVAAVKIEDKELDSAHLLLQMLDVAVNGMSPSDGVLHDAVDDVPAADRRAVPDDVDSYIDTVDWRFLKVHFDFNTTVRQSRFYFSKAVSRRERFMKVAETTTERVAKKLGTRSSYLTLSNSPHFKFLLSIHAFTLNTPGFFEISDADLVRMYEIYFYKLNSVFPIVFEAEFWELYKRNKIPNIIAYAVVLNTARDELADPILARSFVDKTNFKKNRLRFLNDLEMKIRQLLIFLPELGDTEKLARLITQLLLSLSFKFNKYGNEQSSSDVGDCVSYAYSLLIHQEFFHVRIAKEGASRKSEYLKKLWWIIFIFDRLNAVMNGKAMYIKRLDFNINRPTDAPHLNQLVELAYVLDDTLIAVFRPTRRVGAKEVIAPLDSLEGDPEFRPSQFIEEELQVLDNVAEMKRLLTDYRNHESDCKGHLPAFLVEKYRERMVYFIVRLVHHQIILILRTGQIKYSEDSPQLDDFSIGLVEKLFGIFDTLKDGRNHQLVMSAPLIPLLILATYSVPVTARLRMLTKLKNKDFSGYDEERLKRITRLAQAYHKELKVFAEKWWFINEVVESIETFSRRAEGSEGADKDINRAKLSITALTNSDDVENVLPSLLSITSPVFFDDAAEAESDTEGEKKILENTIMPLEELVSDKVLEPPMMFNPLVDFFSTTEDLALRAFEVRTANCDENQPMSSRESVSSSDDVVFDVAHFAELVSNETSFVPNVMDMFSQNHFDMM